jgi:hypothetical protein
LATVPEVPVRVREAVEKIANVDSRGSDGPPRLGASDRWEEKIAVSMRLWEDEIVEKARLRRFTIAWRESVETLLPREAQTFLSYARRGARNVGLRSEEFQWPCLPEYWY